MSSPIIREGSAGGTRSLLRWERFVEKVSFEPAKSEGVTDAESSDDDKDGLTSESRQDRCG